MKVFLIDDDELQTEILTSMINGGEESKINIESTLDTSNITDRVTLYRPDVVILDLHMPNRSGLQVCEDLKKSTLTKNIPIVILSSSEDEGDKIKCFKAGCIDYITKPVSGDTLIQKIKKYGSIGSMYKSLENLARVG